MIFQTYDFSQVEAVLVDSQVSNLRLMRNILSGMGIKRVHPFLTMSGVMETVLTVVPDILLIEAEEADDEALKFVRWVRTDLNSPNPFMCVIVTTWQPTTTLLNRVTNSGADDLLVNPVLSKQMSERVNSLIEERKRFIVTADYIGPDRRKMPRAEVSQIPMLDPPNTLQMKVAGHWNRAMERDKIAWGVAWINAQKIIRDAMQVAILIEFATPGLLQTPPERASFDHLLRVSTFVEDLHRRLIGHSEEASIATNCKAILALIEQTCSTPEQSIVESDLAQIKTQVLDLMCTLNPGRSSEELASEVIDLVAACRARFVQQIAERAALSATQSASQSIVELLQPFPVKRC
ncbi:Response regulator [Gammaproteobacteria bacterium]